MIKYYLKPLYTNQKSFRDKAFVEIEHNIKTLYSYETKVAEIKGNTCRVFGIYTPTTLKHIKEFLKQNEFKAYSKSQIIQDYFKTDL